MPKLRNGNTDIAKFTQWLGRKCRNHNPLSELGFKASERQAMPRMYTAKSKGDVKVVGNDQQDTLVYAAAGRTFAITVRELEHDEFEGLDLVPVEF